MKKNLGTFLAPMVALALVLGTDAGRAALIPIVNSDFESQSLSVGGYNNTSITSWSKTGSDTGVYYPVTPTQYPNGSLTADGHNMAYITGVGTIYQVLTGYTLAADSTYTLTFTVGHRADNTTGFSAYAEIINSSTSAVLGGNTTDITDPGTAGGNGHLQVETLTFTTGSSVTAGQTLEVLLGNSTSSSQVNFDNISLDVVPEPVNVALALFGIIAVGGIAGRRWLASRKNALQSASVSS